MESELDVGQKLFITQLMERQEQTKMIILKQSFNYQMDLYGQFLLPAHLVQVLKEVVNY